MRAITGTGSRLAARRLAEQPLVLLVVVRARVERQDRVALVEGVLPIHGDPVRARLDDVVTGLCLATQARGGDGPGVDDEQILESPRVRNVLVTGEHQM